MVTNIMQQKDTLEITLEKGTDPQELLKAIVGKVRVRKFEVKMTIAARDFCYACRSE